MKFCLQAIALCLSANALAASGDVIQIDHDNLRSYASTVAPTCDQTTSVMDPGVISVHGRGWLFISYDDGQLKTLAHAVVDEYGGYGAGFDPVAACEQQKKYAEQSLLELKLRLNDIKKNNLLVTNHAGICEANYIVTSETGTIRLSDGTTALATTALEWKKKAAACP